MLVLLDLSFAFDTIDHYNLFCILEKYVEICGNALKLVKSYFSNHTQRVQIDNVLSDFANIICGVLTKSPRREHITPVLKKITLAKNSRSNHI